MISASLTPARARARSVAVGLWAAAIFVLQLWLIFAHAPWFDEFQALLISRAPWSDLWANLHYEGHPSLWYFYLGTVDRLVGRSIIALPIAQAFVSAAVMALIWLRSPFPTWAKSLLALNYYVFFEFGVISRSYGLAALLILAAVAFRRSTWGWVLLALAANVAVHFTAATAVIGALMFLQRRNWPGAAVYVMGCVVALATIYPAPSDMQLAAPLVASPAVRALLNLHRLSAIILPDVPIQAVGWSRLTPFPWSVLVGLAGLALGPLTLAGWPAKVGYVALYLVLFAIGVEVYPVWSRHAGALAWYLIGAMWIQVEAEPAQPLPRVFSVWLVLVALCGVFAAGKALVLPFTEYPAVARWITAHGLENRAWGTWPGYTTSPLAALLNRPIINTDKGCAETFTRWNYGATDKYPNVERVRASGAQFVATEERLGIGHPIAFFPAALVGKALTIYDLGPPTHPTVLCVNQ